MKKFYLFFFLISSIITFSQINFEKAYFINNANTRIECLIKNMDWKNNPSTFEYKLDENSQSKTGSIKDVKLFEIYDQSKYVRNTLNVDQSSNNVNKLSSKYEPELMEKTVFLKEVVDGKATLYKFNDGDATKYFLELENAPAEQLIYKQYIFNDEKGLSRIGYNDNYKKQLQNKLICTSVTEKNFSKTEYNEKDLIHLLTEYNQCENPDYVNVVKEQRKGKFNLSLRPRINFTSFKAENIIYGDYNFETKSKIGFGFGLEGEYVFPFNKNKWSVIVEPTYQYYKADDKSTADNFYKISVDYSSVELPAGIRHYFFLKNDSKIFVNAQYIFDVKIKNKIVLKGDDGKTYRDLEGGSNQNFAFGVGYKYGSKYGIEFRYFTKRNILTEYFFYGSNYQNASIIFSYNIL